ncbi:hypothetical protein HCN_p29 (plasmid) [Helicobacter cinaedi PAGU611]|nr:hypothetical protein HCN_p29 [Helicobacter cinaedi PAGU611]
MIRKKKNKMNQTDPKIKNVAHNNNFILIDNLLYKNQNNIIMNTPITNKVAFFINTETR